MKKINILLFGILILSGCKTNHPISSSSSIEQSNSSLSQTISDSSSEISSVSSSETSNEKKEIVFQIDTSKEDMKQWFIADISFTLDETVSAYVFSNETGLKLGTDTEHGILCLRFEEEIESVKIQTQKVEEKSSTLYIGRINPAGTRAMETIGSAGEELSYTFAPSRHVSYLLLESTCTMIIDSFTIIFR